MSPRSDFDIGVLEVRLLLDLDVSTTTGLDTDELRNALNRASAVLLVSHFEGFLKALAEEFVDLLDSGTLESARIPVAIRELHTMRRVNEIARTNDDVARVALLNKHASSIAMLWNGASKPPAGTLDRELVSRQVTSVRADKVNGLFKLFGSDHDVCAGDIDLADELGETTTANIDLSLRDILECRNEIAHGDTTRKPTQEDVKRYITFLLALASRLERIAKALVEVATT